MEKHFLTSILATDWRIKNKNIGVYKMGNPGKFEACTNQELGEYLHKLSLDGCLDNELGEAEYFGFYGLLLDVDGHGFMHLGDKKSYIINEDNNGFFTYTTYDNQELALSAWSKLEYEYDDFMNENNENEDYDND